MKAPAIHLLLLFLSMSASVLSATPSIVDYYKSIPVMLLDDYRYPLELENGAWVSRSDAGYEIKPVVDIENYYLKITDKGTGGGSVEQELALYRTNEGNDIIGVNVTRFDGLGSVCVLKFYRPGEKQWNDITDVVLPKADLSLFLNEEFKIDVAKIGRLLEGIAFLYQLPRVGTAIDMRVDLDRFIIVNREESMKPGSAVREILDNLKYGAVKLLWNKKNTKFIPGEKALFVPSEMVREYFGAALAGSDKAVEVDTAQSEPDSPERRAILYSLREEMSGSAGLDLVFEVKYLKTKNGWAWIHVLPRTQDGLTNFEDLSGLLQETKGRWKLVETRSGECGDDPDCYDDDQYFRSLKTKFPSAPSEIFPKE